MSDTNTKATPKSCSCWSCKRGRGTASGQWVHKHGERALRRRAKVELARLTAGGEVDDDTMVPRAPHTSYTD